VPLRTTGEGFLHGQDLSSFIFTGVRDCPRRRWLGPRCPRPPAAATDPAQRAERAAVRADRGAGSGSAAHDHPALFSGNGGSTDASAVFRVTVPTDAPRLTYTSSYAMEDGFDWGYTVISTDDGKTYQTLSNANTKPTTTPATAGQALTGSSPFPTPQTFDLTPYAGKSVILGFRYLSDPLVNAGGWYIDDVKVGNTVISDGSSTARSSRSPRCARWRFTTGRSPWSASTRSTTAHTLPASTVRST